MRSCMFAYECLSMCTCVWVYCVCVHECVFICTYLCVSVHVYVCMYDEYVHVYTFGDVDAQRTSTPMCMWLRKRTYIDLVICGSVCVYVCMCACVYVCVCLCICMCICTCIRVYVCVCAYVCVVLRYARGYVKEYLHVYVYWCVCVFVNVHAYGQAHVDVHGHV